MSDTPLGWYKWYPRDFMTSSMVRRMSITAQGVYRALLDLQWEDGSVLNDEERAMLGVPQTTPEAKTIIHATDDEWAQFSPFFLQCFPDGKNAVLDEQRQKSINAINRQSESGKLGGSVAGKGRPKPKKGVPKANVRGTSNPTETEVLKEKIEKEFLDVFGKWEKQKEFQPLKEVWPKYQEHRKTLKKNAYTPNGLASMATAFENKAPEGRSAELLLTVINRALLGNWEGLPPSVITEEAENMLSKPQGSEQKFKYEPDPNDPNGLIKVPA